MATKRRLKSMEDLRRYMAYLIIEVDQGKVDAAKASKIGYLVNILKSIIESGDIEKRVTELEKAIQAVDS